MLVAVALYLSYVLYMQLSPHLRPSSTFVCKPSTTRNRPLTGLVRYLLSLSILLLRPHTRPYVDAATWHHLMPHVLCFATSASLLPDFAVSCCDPIAGASVQHFNKDGSVQQSFMLDVNDHTKTAVSCKDIGAASPCIGNGGVSMTVNGVKHTFPGGE